MPDERFGSPGCLPYHGSTMIDTHCHLTFSQLAERHDDVVATAVQAGVDRMICVGTTDVDSVAAKALAEANKRIFFTAGVHPHYAEQVALNQLPGLIELAVHPRCVAFGEMGLDYHYDDPPRPLQHEMFQAQLEAISASDLIKPIVIHCREALDDVLAMISSTTLPFERFVFHCFTGTEDEARRIIDTGAMMSFTGIVTYKNAQSVQAAAKLVPPDRLMIETDAPYLSPEPYRKIRPNEPKFVPAVAAFLSELRGERYELFVVNCDLNAERFFGLRTASQDSS
jgi:TatD DNase family protein